MQHAPIDPTDVVALVLMVLFSLRRMGIKLVVRERFPHVPVQLFEQWRQTAWSAYTLGVRACFLKFALNTVWYYGARGLGPWHAGGGALLFAAWVAGLAAAWYRISEAKKRQLALGIVVRERAQEQRQASAEEGRR